MTTKTDIQTEIINRIIAMLDAGVVPWQKPWVNGTPRNLATGHIYTGYNALVLAIQPFDSEYWITFQQAKEMGGFVQKGAKGTRVLKPNFYVKTSQDDSGNEVKQTKLYGFSEYVVFNVTQCEGLTIPPKPTKTPFQAIEDAQKLWDSWLDRPAVVHLGNQAYWSRLTDMVTLPPKGNWKSNAEYYGTLFHEGIHATGHEKRLNRPSLNEYHTSKEIRGYEELVAEIGACFIMGHLGIVDRVIENSVSYIAGWKQFLNDNPESFMKAVRDAQKAADYIIHREGVSAEV